MNSSPYISSIHINTEKVNPFPYSVTAVKHCKHISFTTPITFLVGDNGTGKSTLLETIGQKLNLPLIGGSIGSHQGFNAARTLGPLMDIEWDFEYQKGFFFRAEDFSAFIDSTTRDSMKQELFYAQFRGEMPDHIIDQMKQSGNLAARQMNKKYGQDMQDFSHGEAYLQIIHQRIKDRGIYLLDEPEAALSPSRQLSLIYFILNHIKEYRAQYIIATHSPMLMAIPGATIYEITEHAMERVELEDTEHYHITKSFLDNPEGYLRHFK